LAVHHGGFTLPVYAVRQPRLLTETEAVTRGDATFAWCFGQTVPDAALAERIAFLFQR